MEKKMAAQYLKDLKCPHCGGETIKDYSEKAGYFYRCPACAKKYRAKEDPVIPDDEEYLNEDESETEAEETTAEKSLADNTEAVADVSEEPAIMAEEKNATEKPDLTDMPDYINMYSVMALVSAILSPINPFGFIITGILSLVAADKKHSWKKYSGCFKVAMLIACMILAFKIIGCIAFMKAAGGYIEIIKSILSVKAVAPVGIAEFLSKGL